MPRILANCTCAVLMMLRLIVTCWDGWAISDGLLQEDFVGYVFRASEDFVVVSGNTIKWWGF